jgi:hypothetical protein
MNDDGFTPLRIELTPEHQQAVQRRRRLVLQEDANMPMEAFHLPIEKWLDFRFRHCDAPGCQIDGIWWDIGLAEDTYALYPSKILPRLRLGGFNEWCEQGIDWVAELVKASHERGLEAFWSNRVCPVDFPQPFQPGESIPHGDPRRENPLKTTHPDWVNACWWPQGLWNLACAAVRERKVAIFREMLTRYPMDGIQLDFARHTPCLPPGREWEHREHATAFVRLVRQTMLEVEAETGHPRLLAARVGEDIDTNHQDGLEVDAWLREGLLDIVNLGGRTTTVDVAGFRAIETPFPVCISVSFDGHHTNDGYYSPPPEYLRGVFRNFRLQGCDTISLFNWACAPPELYDELGLPPMMKSEGNSATTLEAGELATLQGDCMYAVERRGGYPWAGNAVYRNENRPLPAALGDAALALPLLVQDGPRGESAELRVIVRKGDPARIPNVALNGQPVALALVDDAWCDPQVYGDRPQPSAGAWSFYSRANPEHDLLLFAGPVDPSGLCPGENTVEIAGTGIVEKVELSVHASPSA